MGEKRNLPVQTINFKGKFDLDGLLSFLYDWFVRRKFYYNERKYKWRTDENEIRVDTNVKINGYVRYYISYEIRAVPIKTIEMETSRGKVKACEGHFSMDLTGYVLVDWQNLWKGGSFIDWLDVFFRKFIMHQDLEHWYEDNLLDMIKNLKREIQEFLGMEVFH